MKVKYKKNGKRAFHSIKIQKPTPPAKEVVAVKNLPQQEAKKKRGFFSRNLTFFLVLIILFVITFGTSFSPKLIQEENSSFVASVGNATRNITMIPSGRIVFYENAWNFPTVRAVIIDDFSYDLKDGRCIFFHKVFTDAKAKECFGAIDRADAERANDAQE